MFLKYIYFCLYINLRYLVIHDHTDLTQHFDAFHACCSDDLFIKCLYVDHKIYILLVDNVTKKNTNRIIRRVLNTQNIKKNEIVAKKRREKFKFDVCRHNIKIKIAKVKITRFNLNSYDYHVFWNAKNKMFNKFKSRKEFYIVSFNQKCTIIRKCWIFIKNANRE